MTAEQLIDSYLGEAPVFTADVNSLAAQAARAFEEQSKVDDDADLETIVMDLCRSVKQPKLQDYVFDKARKMLKLKGYRI